MLKMLEVVMLEIIPYHRKKSKCSAFCYMMRISSSGYFKKGYKK